MAAHYNESGSTPQDDTLTFVIGQSAHVVVPGFRTSKLRPSHQSNKYLKTGPETRHSTGLAAWAARPEWLRGLERYFRRGPGGRIGTGRGWRGNATATYGENWRKAGQTGRTPQRTAKTGGRRVKRAGHPKNEQKKTRTGTRGAERGQGPDRSGNAMWKWNGSSTGCPPPI